MDDLPSISLDDLQSAFESTPLFDKKSWQLSPAPWQLTKEQLTELEKIGRACLEFYQAIELLYRKSFEEKKLLRNADLLAPWVAEYFERGKPEKLIAHGRNKLVRNELPMVMRPDLLLTDEGFVLTELDSVPGGIGLTAFLNQLYAPSTADILGANSLMLEAFYESLLAKVPAKSNPFIAIIVSDEAATYRPEMEWLAAYHQRKGRKLFVYSPQDIFPLEHGLFVDFDGDPHRIDLIYRFWELFDMSNLPLSEMVFSAVEAGEVAITPPLKTYHEEKLSLALFHHPVLQAFWKESLSKEAFKTLRKIIPESWVVDHDQLPPHAFLLAPMVADKPIHQWEELANGSRKERELVLKKSGFHEEAWGARSVVLGHDTSKEEFAHALRAARDESTHSLSVIQRFHKPKRLQHPIYREDGTTYAMDGRLRLCPYYFVKDNTPTLTGALATFCPADKKIIHGMKDAALLPCAVVPS